MISSEYDSLTQVAHPPLSMNSTTAAEGENPEQLSWYLSAAPGSSELRDLAAQRVQDCMRRNSSELDLSNLGLRSLPEALPANIVTLNVQDNQLSSIPAICYQETGIRDVYLAGNIVSPEWIKCFKHADYLAGIKPKLHFKRYEPGTEQEDVRQGLCCVPSTWNRVRRLAVGNELIHQLESAAAQLSDFLANTGEAGAGRRWAGNLAAAGLRTGTIVTVTTVLRQVTGFALEKMLQLSLCSSSVRHLLAVIALMVGPALNIAGLTNDEHHQVATGMTRVARAVMLALSLGTLATLVISTSPEPLSSMASLAPQMLIYTLSRDLAQLFFPIQDNNDGQNIKGTIVSAVGFASAQVALGELFTLLAPHSGASYVMRVGRYATEGGQDTLNRMALRSLLPHWQHDVLAGMMNAVVEIYDDLFGGLARFVYSRRSTVLAISKNGDDAVLSQRSIPGFRYGLDRPRLGHGHWPTAAECRFQFLNVNAARTSLLHSIVVSAVLLSFALQTADFAPLSGNLLNHCLCSAVIIVGYIAFIYSLAQRRAPQVDGPSFMPA